MKNQPVLDLPASSIEKMLDAAALLMAGGALFIAISQFPGLPDQIPLHFNAKGEIDDYGSKYTLFFLPGIALILSIGLLLLSRIPHHFNYPYKITPENAAFEYKRSQMLLRIINILVALMFLVLTWNIVRAAQGATNSLHPVFWVVFGLMMVTPIGYLLLRRKSSP